MLRRRFRALPEAPRALLLQVRLHLRDMLKARAGYARPRQVDVLPEQRRWAQVIYETGTAEAKRHNLRIAAKALNRTIAWPGQVLSFARVIGPPIALRGYRKGRALLAGAVAESTGGGLCQLSGMLYLAALECGLEVVERHPHSFDIYTEATRFAPLGADASVVYGHRDLRIRNSLDIPIGFRCEITRQMVTLVLCSEHEIPQRRVEFWSNELDAQRTEVATVIDGLVVGKSIYIRATT